MQKCCRVRPHTFSLERADSFFTLSKYMHPWKCFSKWLLQRAGGVRYSLLFCHCLMEGFGKIPLSYMKLNCLKYKQSQQEIEI